MAGRERENHELITARVRELGGEERIEQFRPFFDAFFARTDPTDWVEAQAFHYVGDALVSDFADLLVRRVDRVSAEVVRRALGDREGQETFALDELTRAMAEDPATRNRSAATRRGSWGRLSPRPGGPWRPCPTSGHCSRATRGRPGS